MLVAALVLGGGNGGVIQAAEDYEVKDPVNTMADGTGITTWDCVYFGNYIQKDTNGDGKVTDEDEKQPQASVPVNFPLFLPYSFSFSFRFPVKCNHFNINTGTSQYS